MDAARAKQFDFTKYLVEHRGANPKFKENEYARPAVSRLFG